MPLLSAAAVPTAIVDCIQPMFSIQIGSVPVMSRPRSGGRAKRASG